MRYLIANLLGLAVCVGLVYQVNKESQTTASQPAATSQPVRAPARVGKGLIVKVNSLAELESLSLPSQITAAQLSFAWADLEPQDDQWNWKPVHDFINACKAKGIRAVPVFGTAPFAPTWFFDKPDVLCVGGKDSVPKLQVFWDWRYLAEIDAFIAAFGREFSKNPWIEYVRLGGWQVGTNEPTFYGDYFNAVSDDLIKYGWTGTRSAQGRPVFPSATDSHSQAVGHMIQIWRLAFPNTYLGVTIHQPAGGTAPFDQRLIDYVAGVRYIRLNTGLNEGDHADLRTSFRAWHDSGTKVGWGGITNLGSKVPTLVGEPLRQEAFMQGLGSDLDSKYSPASRVSYFTFGSEMFAYKNALDTAAHGVVY